MVLGVGGTAYLLLLQGRGETQIIKAQFSPLVEKIGLKEMALQSV